MIRQSIARNGGSSGVRIRLDQFTIEVCPEILIVLLALALNSRSHMSQGSMGCPINGVLTGAAAPTSCVTLLSPVFETHTLPDPSIAIPSGLFIEPPW